MRAKSLTRPVVGLYALRMLLGATIFVVLLLSLLAVQRDSSRTHSTTDTLIQALNIEHSVGELNIGLRSYLLSSGNRAALAPFERARRQLPGEMEALVADAQTADERTAATNLIAAVTGDLQRYAVPLSTPGVRLGQAPTIAEARRGTAAAAALERQFTAFVQMIVNLRNRRHSQVTSEVSLAIVVAGVGLALSLLLEFGFQLFLVRGVLRPIRRVARAAARLAHGELSARVPSTGLGEVGMLGDAFNGMAESTQARTTELAEAQQRLARTAAVAEEASAMKSTFVANITHEIRTPLNGLVGMLSLLAETPLDEDQRNYVEVARSSSDALLAVVGDVLDIAKIESGRLEIEQLEFDLHETVESVCDLMSASAAAKRLSLQPYLSTGVPRTVVGDRTRVAQILQNLVSNAVKFTPAGEVTVEVGVVSPSGADDGGTVRVAFWVHDTGIGIEPRQLSDLFEPFVQAEPGTTRKFGGTGLGLAIARELTEAMGGVITSDSAPGEGSTFGFELPFARAAALVPNEERAAGGLAGVELLVVDPGANVRRAVESYAESWGMRARTAPGLDQAAGLLRGGATPQVVVIDAELGIAAADDLARAVGAAGEVVLDPVSPRLILLTSAAGAREGDGAMAIRIAKPVRRVRLLRAIAAALAGEPDAAGITPPVAATNGVARRSARRVLVADDHDVNWLVMERMLTSRGHSSVRAHDGEEVLELLRDGAYDLLLIDCQMPVLDGYDTARELRRREVAGELRQPAGAERLPVVAMTAESLEGSRERCLSAGMDDYLPKPITLAELDAMLELWLPPDPVQMLDHDRIDILQQLFPGTELGRMVAEMRAEIERDLAELDSALRQRDQARVAAAAHRIRNTGQLLGADGLVASAAELDRPPRPDRQPVAFDEGALVRLQKHWESTQSALAALADPS